MVRPAKALWGEHGEWVPAQLIVCANVVMVVQDQLQHLALQNVNRQLEGLIPSSFLARRLNAGLPLL